MQTINSSASDSVDDFVLAEHGCSAACIQLDVEANFTEKFAAEEFCKYVQRVTGAQVPILDGAVRPNRPSILMGALAQRRSQVPPPIERDGYRILSSENQIFIFGRSPRASLYGVYDFLERFLGCAWIYPADDVVPHRPSVKIPLPLLITESPAFEYRALLLFPFNQQRALEDIDWIAKNRLNVAHVAVNSSREGPVLGLQLWHQAEARKTIIPELQKRGLDLHFGGHTFFVWVPPEKYFATHPEYFSLRNGQRAPDALCLSNPEVVEVAAQNMFEFLAENPEVGIMDCWNNDVHDWCECPGCQEMEGPQRPSILGHGLTSKTDSALQFVNAVAARMKDRYPRLQINFLAYHRLVDAPLRVKPAENVQVGFAPLARMASSEKNVGGYYNPLQSDRDEVNRHYWGELQKWLKLTRNFYTYDYFTQVKTLGASRKYLQGRRMEFFPIMESLAKDLCLYAQSGVRGVSTEQVDWDDANMPLYARLAWNPNQSVAALLQRFCQQFYGEAHVPMLNFWICLLEAKASWRLEKERCQGWLEQALSLTQDSRVRARIGRLKDIWLGRSAERPFRDNSPFPFLP